jgi:ubiquinone/menaquinone biosynthesis C-methylase UbiE
VGNSNGAQYLMEHEEEALRLDMKTRPNAVEEQALFAGVKPDMRLLDIGCGSGKTTSVLHGLLQPGGEAIGIDVAENRISYARDHYGRKGIEFVRRDMRDPLDDLGEFDFLWMRFVLEYYRTDAWPIVQHVTKTLKPGGTLCLIDLDHNCMNHFEMPERLETTVRELFDMGQTKANFDPYAGRKLYSHLYRLNFTNIRARVGAHHVIYNELNDIDAYNWLKKIEVGIRKLGFDFHRYSSGYDGFVEEFMRFFNDPGRFTYTPLISVCGHKTTA